MLMNLKKFNYKMKNKKWSVSQHNQFVSIDQYFTTHIRKWNFKLCRSLLYLWFSFSIHKKVWAKFQHVTIYLSMHGIGIRSVEDLKTTSLKKVVPNISRSKKSRHFLMHWMSVKLPDNFQMRKHSWPCRFHII
jgi:hypothetical protein